MAISHSTPNVQDPRFSSLVYPTVVPATSSTAGNLTWSASQVLGGLLLRDPNGASRTDTLPSAVLLAAAIQGALVGTSFEFTIRNTADANETITVAAGSGGAASGTMTIAQNNSKRFLVVLTAVASGSEAYTVYSLGSLNSLAYPLATVTTLATAGDATLTAAQILGTLVLRDPNGSARTDTLPTAALLVAAMSGAAVGNTFEFTIRNSADADETITVAAGSGGTASGTMTIAQNNSKRFQVVLTNVTASAEAYGVYSLGTVTT